MARRKLKSASHKSQTRTTSTCHPPNQPTTPKPVAGHWTHPTPHPIIAEIQPESAPASKATCHAIINVIIPAVRADPAAAKFPLTEHLRLLAVSFMLILGGSELFTNGVEWAGKRFNVAEAAVGSLLAAVGTALPETFVPIVALLMPGEGAHERGAVGIGAIIGAPLML